MDNQKQNKITKVGFIKPDNHIDFLNYYEVESYCIKEIQKYTKDEENRKRFEKFTKKYTYFHPYFDFVVFEMGYRFLNPLLEKGEFGFCKKENETIDLAPITHSIIMRSTKMDDQTLKIQEIDLSYENSSIITPNGLMLLKQNFISHGDLLNHILNQILIQSKTIFEDYIKYQNHCSYLIQKLGFYWYAIYENGDMNLLYNPSLSTKEQIEFLYWLKDYYPFDYHYTPYTIEENEKKEAKELINEYQKTFTWNSNKQKELKNENR